MEEERWTMIEARLEKVEGAMCEGGKGGVERLVRLKKRQERIVERIELVENGVVGGAALGKQENGGGDGEAQATATTATEVRYCATEVRLGDELRRRGMAPEMFSFKHVAQGYYDKSLSARKTIVGAESIRQLCKSIVLVNTRAAASQAPHDVTTKSDASTIWDEPYVLVIVQYCTRLHSEKVKSAMHARGTLGLGKKKMNFQLLAGQEAVELTGYKHNAVTPVGTLRTMPILISDKIVSLPQPDFWLGGGEELLKLRVDTSEFLRVYGDLCAVEDVTYEYDNDDTGA